MTNRTRASMKSAAEPAIAQTEEDDVERTLDGGRCGFGDGCRQRSLHKPVGWLASVATRRAKLSLFEPPHRARG